MNEDLRAREGQSSNKTGEVNKIPLMSWQTLNIINYNGNIIKAGVRQTRECTFIGQVVWCVRGLNTVLVESDKDYVVSLDAIIEALRLIKIIRGIQLKREFFLTQEQLLVIAMHGDAVCCKGELHEESELFKGVIADSINGKIIISTVPLFRTDDQAIEAMQGIVQTAKKYTGIESFIDCFSCY